MYNVGFAPHPGLDQPITEFFFAVTLCRRVTSIRACRLTDFRVVQPSSRRLGVRQHVVATCIETFRRPDVSFLRSSFEEPHASRVLVEELIEMVTMDTDRVEVTCAGAPAHNTPGGVGLRKRTCYQTTVAPVQAPVTGVSQPTRELSDEAAQPLLLRAAVTRHR